MKPPKCRTLEAVTEEKSRKTQFWERDVKTLSGNFITEINAKCNALDGCPGCFWLSDGRKMCVEVYRLAVLLVRFVSEPCHHGSVLLGSG